MKSKVVILIVILVLIFGAGYIVVSSTFWEKGDIVYGKVFGRNAGEGGGYNLQIIEGEIK